MHDLIRRNELMKFVRCRNNTNCKTCEFYTERDSWCDGEVFGTLIMQMPVVDAVEVVRCKDCTHKDDELCPDGLLWCNHFERAMLEYEFCSHGTRSEDEEE